MTIFRNARDGGGGGDHVLKYLSRLNACIGLQEVNNFLIEVKLPATNHKTLREQRMNIRGRL